MEIIFYCNIDKILRQRNLTLTELSELSGLSKGNLSTIRKLKAITMKSLSKLATGLNETEITELVDINISIKQ